MMISKFTQEAGKKKSVASIKMMFFDNVVGELPTRLLTFLELLGHEEEPYGGMSSLQLIIREVLARENTKTKLHASQVDAYLFSPRLNPAFDSSSCASSSTPVTLKIKVYMGNGWKQDFPMLDLLSPPDLYVKVHIMATDKDSTTKVVSNNWEPVWAEELTLQYVDRGADILSIKVYDHDQGKEDQFAGMATMFVSQIRPGTRAIPLLKADGKTVCPSTSLLMRFTIG